MGSNNNMDLEKLEEEINNCLNNMSTINGLKYRYKNNENKDVNILNSLDKDLKKEKIELYQLMVRLELFTPYIDNIKKRIENTIYG